MFVFEEPISFYHKPHEQMSTDELARLGRMRHNVRGYLGSMELIAMRLAKLNLEKLTPDLDSFGRYFVKLGSYFPKELTSELSAALIYLSKNGGEAGESPLMARRVSEVVAKMKSYHYYKDRWWQPSSRQG